MNKIFTLVCALMMSLVAMAGNIANTIETAYTVDEAIDLIYDSTSVLTDSVYVQGVVDNVTEFSMEYNNMTYTIGSGFVVFRGKWLYKADVYENCVQVGDTVIVKGVLTLYNNSICELRSGNYIVYHKSPGSQWPTDALENNTVTKAVKVLRDGQVLIKKNDEWYDVIGRKIIK